MSRQWAFEGQSVVVTGGTSASVRARRCGSRKPARRSSRSANAAGPHAPVHAGVRCVELDVTDSDALTRTIAALPRLDVLVNGVGISRHADEYRMDQFGSC